MKTIATFIGVWFVASLTNGFLSGISITICDSGFFSNPVESVFLITIGSLIFSVPLVGVVWLTAVIAQATGKTGHAFFQLVLLTAFIAGIAGALFFNGLTGSEFNIVNYATGGSIIISATGSIIVFRKRLINEH